MIEFERIWTMKKKRSDQITLPPMVLVGWIRWLDNEVEIEIPGIVHKIEADGWCKVGGFGGGID